MAAPSRTVEASAGDLLDRRARAFVPTPGRAMTSPEDVRAFVRERGIVLTVGRGELPNLGFAIAGREFAGSWMATPEVHLIADLLDGLERPEFWQLPLIDGKLTVVHERLGAAVTAYLLDPARRERSAATLSPAAAELLARVDEEGWVRMDAWSTDTAAGRKVRTELERKHLASSESIHTDRGFHVAAVVAWERTSFVQRFRAASRGIGGVDAADALAHACLHAAVAVPKAGVRRLFDGVAEAIARLCDRGAATLVPTAGGDHFVLTDLVEGATTRG